MPFIIITYGPHPSCAPFRVWQTIVELIIRGVVTVLALLALISCSVAEDDTDDCDSDDNCGLLRSSNAAAGWGIFVTFVAALIEVNILINRFLNCGYISVYWIVCIIIDMIISGVSAFVLFITAIPLAVYGAEWAEESDSNGRISPSLQTASAFCFLTMFAFIALFVWMLLHVIFGWCKKSEATHSPEA